MKHARPAPVRQINAIADCGRPLWTRQIKRKGGENQTSTAATSTSSEATVSPAGAGGVEGASSAPCGSAWNRHITYIMIDFLSGRGVWTSVTTILCFVRFDCHTQPRAHFLNLLLSQFVRLEIHRKRVPSGSSNLGMPRCVCASANACSSREAGARCNTAA